MITLIQQGAPAPAMLPPMVEIAEHFGVTRMTVHKALKDLIRDNYLISRKGIGTFINPSRMIDRDVGAPQRQFAVVVGEGKHCYYDSFYWEHITAVGQEITRRGHLVNLINLMSVKPDEMAKELRNNLVEGVVWIDSSGRAVEVMHALHNSGYPVVSVHQYVDGVNSVGMNYTAHAAEIGQRLLNERRKNIVFVGRGEVPAVQMQLNAMRGVFQKNGLDMNEQLVLLDPATMESEIRTIVDYGVDVQALYAAGQHLSTVVPVLKEKQVDFAKGCRIICEQFDVGASGVGKVGKVAWMREYGYQEEAQVAVGILERMLAEKDFTVETVSVPFHLRRSDDVV